MKGVSIKDIAKKTGVSATTVSIVMNGKGKDRKISDKLIDEILGVAEELNYRPNQFAKSLRTGKTYTLGLIVDDISNFFFGHLARVVEEEANKFGYTVMFCNSENDEGKARNVLGSLLDKQMDGYIIAPTSSMMPEIERLIAEKKPLILIDRYIPSLSTSYVTIDNYKGAFESVEHFVRQGYKNIAIVINESDQVQILERFEGYKGGLCKYRLPFRPDLVQKIPFNYSDRKAVKEIERFLKQSPFIDAVLFTGNQLGICGLESLRNLNRRVATDIGVICFDDNDLFRLASPGITVVSQPIKAIGKNAIKILLGKVDRHLTEEKHVVLQPNLIIRDSTPFK